jgi:ketosteroid isomerase-like protein
MSTQDLARRFFALVESRDRRGLGELLHPDVEFVPITFPGGFHGSREVIDGFYGTVFSWTVYEAVASRFVSTADDTVHVEGRLRWMSNGELRDVNAAWILRFDDGKLVSLSAAG